MPGFQFSPGHLCGVAWQAQGQGGPTPLGIFSHDLKLAVLLHDVTGVLAGGVRARIAGPLDCDGSIQNHLDLTAPPYVAQVTITPGVSGVAAFALSPTKSIQVPLICEALHFVSAVDKDVQWDSAWKMNSLAGFVVYPPL